MREIKFRAWDKKEQRMSLPFDAKKNWGDFLIDFGDWNADGASEWMEWLQYTGLKDKNGVEIYEGDIIDFNDLDTDVRIGQEARDWRAKVVYNSFGTRFVAETFKPYWDGNKQFYQGYTEVIGNIYENPDLLKAQDA